MNNSITARWYDEHRQVWRLRRHFRAFGYEPHWKTHERMIAQHQIQRLQNEAINEAVAEYERQMASEPVTVN